MSGRSSGSNPYKVTESNAVDRRVAGWPSASRWNRLFVRAGPPSPANMRAGSSFSRLSGNTPAVEGERPGAQTQPVPQVLVQGRHTVVVEVGGDGAEHRDVGALAGDLASYVAKRVLAPPAVELVDGDGVGEVEHVDLLELAGGAELGRHDVQRHVDERHDAGVALADAGRLDDHQIEPGRLARVDGTGKRDGHLAGRGPRGERAEEHV